MCELGSRGGAGMEASSGRIEVACGAESWGTSLGSITLHDRMKRDVCLGSEIQAAVGIRRIMVQTAVPENEGVLGKVLDTTIPT